MVEAYIEESQIFIKIDIYLSEHVVAEIKAGESNVVGEVNLLQIVVGEIDLGYARTKTEIYCL